MTELQERLVDMLQWFHKLCEKNHLRYYIIAGTMLGAIRHQGFIPWDDDIDVGIPRSDYEKLKDIISCKQDDNYVIEYPNMNTDYPYLIAKVYDTKTTFIEKQRNTVKRGIYIDIFPLDGIGNTMQEAEKNYKIFSRNFKLNLMISGAFLKRRGIKKNLAVLCGRVLSPLFVNKKHLSIKIDNICKRYDFDNCKIVSNLMGGAGKKGFIPVEYFGIPTLIQFENITVYGLENPHMYLKSMYGDYMELPPVEKRVSLHDNNYCDLKKSYLKD